MIVLLADDHPLVRDAIRKLLLEEIPDARLLESETLEEAIQTVRSEASIDLVLLDLKMPGMNGINGIRVFREHHPNVNVAVISGYYHPRDIFEALDHGATGFLPKSMTLDQLVEIIKLLATGHQYVPMEIMNFVKGDTPALAGGDFSLEVISNVKKLTSRERTVLSLLIHGLMNKEIAAQLDLQEVTVKMHLRNIYRKLGVKNRTQAVRLIITNDGTALSGDY